jgi:hypothetical protein
MSHIFISYSSKNREFALRLADDLIRLCKIWIDREGIHAGLEWEQAIEKAIRECEAFLVIVSPDSNSSDWVARETILAEKLDKYRVPVLLNGELPFRLLNLHYVDFQGNYEGGLKDLLEAINDLIHPEEKTKDEVNRLLGTGIRAYLNGKIDDANGLIGQALALEPAIAATVEDFWLKIRGEPTTNFAADFMPLVRIIEHTAVDGKVGNRTYFAWNVEIAAPESVLNQIDSVKYSLHKTFNPPFQIVRSRHNNFRLSRSGWGTFNIPVEIIFKDGSVGTTKYQLTFDSA